jgi:hypothetical protein
MLQASLFHQHGVLAPAILSALAQYRVLALHQLQALLGVDHGLLETELQALRQHGYIAAVTGFGRREDDTTVSAWVLRRAGAKAASGALGGEFVTAPDTRRLQLFLAHELLVRDVAISFHLLQKAGHIERVDIEHRAEHLKLSTRTRHINAQGLVSLVPDLVVRVKTAEQLQILIVEVDMGSVQSARMEKKYQRYFSLFRERAWLSRFGTANVRVLTTAPRGARLTLLRRLAIGAVGGTGTGLFWFLPNELVSVHSPHTLLDANYLIAREPPSLVPLFASCMAVRRSPTG